MKNLMKKLSLSLLVLTMTGCSNTSTMAGQVKKGKAVSVEEAKEVMVKAADSMAKDDSLSLTMDNASFHNNTKMEMSVPLGKETAGFFTTESKMEIKNFKMNGAMTGLTSTIADDIKGNFGFKADVNYSGLTKANNLEQSYSAPSGTMGFNAYLDGEKAYLDLSDNKLKNVVKIVIGNGTGDNIVDNNFNLDVSADGKYCFDSGLKDATLPLMTEEKLNEVMKKTSEGIEKVASMGGKVQAQIHDDGTYSYSVSIKDLKDYNGDTDELPVKDDIFDQEMSDMDSAFGVVTNKNIQQHLNVNDYAIAFIFNESGIQSIGLTFDMDYTYKLSYKINDVTYENNITMDYAINAKLRFNSGKDVNIPEISDKDSYKEVKFDFDGIDPLD